MNSRFTRTNSSDRDFTGLVRELDEYLAEKDGEDHPFYDQYNKLDSIKYALVAYEKEIPVACGAIKEFGPGVMEVKRMFTLPGYRGKGLASMVLKELEQWAMELGYSKCILETGKRQVEAIDFYKKNNYEVIPNFGQYAGVEYSICFEKNLLE